MVVFQGIVETVGFGRVWGQDPAPADVPRKEGSGLLWRCIGGGRANPVQRVGHRVSSAVAGIQTDVFQYRLVEAAVAQFPWSAYVLVRRLAPPASAVDEDVHRARKSHHKWWATESISERDR